MNCEQVRELLGKKERADLGFYPTQSNHALQTVEACRRERARQRQTRECTACDIPELFCYSCHALFKRIIFDLFLENRNGS